MSLRRAQQINAAQLKRQGTACLGWPSPLYSGDLPHCDPRMRTEGKKIVTKRSLATFENITAVSAEELSQSLFNPLVSVWWNRWWFAMRATRNRLVESSSEDKLIVYKGDNYFLASVKINCHKISLVLLLKMPWSLVLMISTNIHKLNSVGKEKGTM